MYRKGQELILKVKAANEFNIFKKVVVMDDTPKENEFLVVEGYREETDELIELIIQKDQLLKQYR